jgi:hypothetical protein
MDSHREELRISPKMLDYDLLWRADNPRVGGSIPPLATISNQSIGLLLDLWAYHNLVTMEFSHRGQPTDNGHIKSLDGRHRDECLVRKGRAFRATIVLSMISLVAKLAMRTINPAMTRIIICLYLCIDLRPSG